MVFSTPLLELQRHRLHSPLAPGEGWSGRDYLALPSFINFIEMIADKSEKPSYVYDILWFICNFTEPVLTGKKAFLESRL